MAMPARLAQFLYLTAWDLLLPDVVEKPLKVMNHFYQCFICADPAERLALLAEAGPLTDAQIEEVVNHLAAQWRPYLSGGVLADAQRALLRQLARSLHAAGQPAATNDPAKAVRQSLEMEAPKALPPEQREVCRSLVHTALQGTTNRGASPLPADVPTVPGYTLLRVLGSGAFSTVYLAQEDGGTLIALKVIKLADAAQFRREVRTLSQVSGEYLVAYRAHGEIGDRFWIAMNYVGETTLAHLIVGRPSAEGMLPLAEQILSGLDELHRQKVVHRDLKPENAVVGDDYRLRLIDFGLSKKMEEAGVSTTLGTAGTALYMSPEQIHGEATYASDVWAFGCLLYEMFVGRPLFEGKNIMQVAQEIGYRAISLEVEGIPAEVRPFLARCLQRNAADRYTDATEALAEFVKVAAETRQRLRYERYYQLWGQVLDKRLLERFAEECQGQLPADAVTRFQKGMQQEGLPEIDEERLAQILPPIVEEWRKVVTAEGAVLEAREQLQRDVAHLSGAELATLGQQLAELEKVPEQRRAQVRQVIETQLARERAGWEKFKEAEERKREEAQAAERKRIADVEAAEELRRTEAAVAEAKRREQAETDLRRSRERLVYLASVAWLVFMFIGTYFAVREANAAEGVTRDRWLILGLTFLLSGMVTAGIAEWRRVRSLAVAPLSEFQHTYAVKNKLPVCKTLSYNGVKFEFVLIPPGKFRMGQPGTGSDETPHPVEITEPFYLLTTEVTQAMYQAVMGTNPSHFTGDNKRPVEQVSWNQANEFCDKITKALGMIILLPTEAQWEYACRAGSTAEYSFGDDEAQLAEHAWYGKNSGSTTHPVGTRKPNAWGLYDMHGNVWEWCLDAYRSDYEKLPAKDPCNIGQPNNRCVLRGGSWINDSGSCRAACRYYYAPDIRHGNVGFRLCCSP